MSASDPVHTSGVASPLDDYVAAIRRFNRFHTRWVGALDEGYLETTFTLAEARIVYELANRNAPTATELRRDLELDAGYLSRLLASLVKRRMVKRVTSSSDARRTHLQLTEKGSLEFKRINSRSSRDILRHIQPLSQAEQRSLVLAMATIERLLDHAKGEAPAKAGDNVIVLRVPEPGDYGWIVERHGVLYSKEYGWDERFEALVAEIVAHFVQQVDAKRERCWVAERNGERVGSVFLVRHPEREGVAKLRLLLVEPSARGLGIGHRLVDECIRFARRTGYRTMTLWTNSILISARRIYEERGFVLVNEEPHNKFGTELIGQTWELAL